jgi:hypothetical protein
MDKWEGEDTSSRFVSVVACYKNRRNASEECHDYPRTPCPLASRGKKDVTQRRDGRERREEEGN